MYATRAKNRGALHSPRPAASRRRRPTGSPSPFGSIHRLVLSITYCFGPGCKSWPASSSANSGKRVHAPPTLVAKFVAAAWPDRHRTARCTNRDKANACCLRRSANAKKSRPVWLNTPSIIDANVSCVSLPDQLQKQLVGRGPLPAFRIARLLGHDRQVAGRDRDRNTDRCDETNCRRICAATARRTAGLK